MAILSDINMEKEFEDLTNVLKPLLTNTNNDCEWISDVSFLSLLNDTFKLILFT